MLEMVWKFVFRQSQAVHFSNMRGKLCYFVEKFGGLHWKKLKLGTDTPCRRTPNQNKDQTEKYEK